MNRKEGTEDRSGCQEKEKPEYELKMQPYDGFNYPVQMHNVADHLRNIRDMTLRDDDIFITSYPKSGTHWINEVVYMLLQGHASYCRKHCWLDVESIDTTDNAPSPRIIITHVPIKWLPWRLSQGRVKVIYMTRNPKDVVVSHYNFVANMAATAFDGEFNYSYIDKFLNGDVVYDSWFRSVLGWEKFPDTHPNVPFMMMNYENMKLNLRQEVERVAFFLGKSFDEDLLDKIVESCSFSKTKHDKQENPDPRFKTFARDGSQILYRKGEVGDWKNWFTVTDSEKFDQVYKEKMLGSKLTFRFSL
ncbi:sulfotransferase family cytosolic 1B member 1-like [Mizuhopecten yessoensis]|uniref:sulfotransferase family cytosolic 1B member 1-like n=1 Tax=Mizuhopecten yessoensis TaxID=6573 RepID=UPI000B45F2F8|nr:sulfotransferase family cytosolic 1B member 1-like [Mizuhopecten yessoensis]XP_021377939.1 sulfotransferase family cytosolic 1B member 1-like [Mizuhopecten yessoensis]XP_021377940.1 sulfotransferase family cytosolic 1B member 1-like [Mizuhopecten yessoensis]XP_021377941.1 sulfotransferase family cytosolic 1B member 1-like [Mizuhopecten yessoensis]XP_021377942.1 sulfotransferase family cytosolic 1B member 1-like [Mizuhopecten yessoensis]